jgi:hypothetical protein
MTKRITYNAGDWDMFVDERYIGSRATRAAAQAAIDAYVYEALVHGDTRTAAELDGAQAEGE